MQQHISHSFVSAAEAVCPEFDLRSWSLSRRGRSLLSDITLDIRRGETLALIGSTRSGKSVLLRSLMRFDEQHRRRLTDGDILFRGQSIFDRKFDLPMMRQKVAYVPEQCETFPGTIWENLAYGPKIAGLARKRSELDEVVERCLRTVRVWDELKDQLHKTKASELRPSLKRLLAIARGVSIEAEVLLLDKPASHSWNIGHPKYEGLLEELCASMTVVFVPATLNIAAAHAHRIAFLDAGRLVEVENSEMLLTAPLHPATQRYLEAVGSE